jgi:hypothetical protein
MDFHKREIIRVERLATGGRGDELDGKTHEEKILDHCVNAEYVPELLPNGTRKDLKRLDVTQPDGPSFKVTDNSLVEWQNWRFRVSFNPREGAVIHDVHYNGRSVLYRLSISEMTVPYADARESRRSTSAMAAQAIAQTTSLWDATVSELSNTSTPGLSTRRVTSQLSPMLSVFTNRTTASAGNTPTGELEERWSHAAASW